VARRSGRGAGTVHAGQLGHLVEALPGDLLVLLEVLTSPLDVEAHAALLDFRQAADCRHDDPRRQLAELRRLAVESVEGLFVDVAEEELGPLVLRPPPGPPRVATGVGPEVEQRHLLRGARVVEREVVPRVDAVALRHGHLELGRLVLVLEERRVLGVPDDQVADVDAARRVEPARVELDVLVVERDLRVDAGLQQVANDRAPLAAPARVRVAEREDPGDRRLAVPPTLAERTRDRLGQGERRERDARTHPAVLAPALDRVLVEPRGLEVDDDLTGAEQLLAEPVQTLVV
jgi:hypothetical protein